VRERLAVVEYAVAHGLKPTAARFDLGSQDRAELEGDWLMTTLEAR